MNKPRILIVEDEAIVARDISVQLVSMGYEVIGQTAYAEQAITLAQERRPDLVLMDIHLAGVMDGIAAAQAIRERFSLPVVFLTAFTGGATLTRAKLAEPFGYITKPFNERELHTVVEIALHKHQTETALRRSETKFRTLFDSTSDAVMLLDAEGFLDCNQATLTMFGCASRELFCTKHPADLYPPLQPGGIESVSLANQHLKAALVAGSLRLEWMHRRLDTGETFPAEILLNAMRLDGKSVLQVVVRDISVRKKADQDLHEARQLLDSVIENMPAMVFVKRASDLRFELLNRAGEELLGHSRSELIGKNDHDFFPREQADAFTAEDRKILARGGVGDIPVEPIVGAGGETHYLHTRKVVLRDQAGQATHLLGISLDITERMRSEAALGRTSELVRTSQLAMVGGWDLDLLTMTLYWSPETCRIYEVDPPVAPALDQALNFCAPEARPTMEAAIRAGIEQGTPFDLELSLITAKGRSIWARILGSAVMQDGRAMQLIGAVQDITDRKQAELAQQASEVQLRGILESTADGILAVDATGKVVQANGRFAEMWCIPSALLAAGNDEDLLRFVLEQLIDPDAFISKVRELYASNADDIDTLMFKDGRMVERHSSPLILNGIALGRVWSFSDITARNQAEAVRARLAAIVENSNDAIFSRALDGTILSWNAGAEKMLGYTAAEAIGKPSSFVRPPNRVANLAQNNAAALRGEVVVRETVRLTKDGRVVAVMASQSPIRDSAGRLVGASVILQDITALQQAQAAVKEAEAQLREAQKIQAIGTLAGGIAHDFNNIIAIILGNIELMRLDVRAIPHALQCVERIHLASVRARDLVRQILAFSRRQPTLRKPMSLIPVVEETERLLRATLPARLGVAVYCAPDTPSVLADATQIQQALINLATNAMQAMPSGPGHISIRLEKVMLDEGTAQRQPALRILCAQHPGGAVRLSVIDNGPGIDADTLKRIFEPFYTTKLVGEGTGLGLSVVHGIVQGHDGAIVVDSQSGKGARFMIYLPATATQVEVPQSTTGSVELPPSRQGYDPQILYIDDEIQLVTVIKALLERRGYRVSAHTDPHAALAILRADAAAFDLVLTDYNMPTMSGLDVAREVRAIRGDLAVAIVSGFIDEGLRAQFAEAGVRELISKADAVQSICDTVKQLLQGVQEKSTRAAI